jgi:hypothetical protein
VNWSQVKLLITNYAFALCKEQQKAQKTKVIFRGDGAAEALPDIQWLPLGFTSWLVWLFVFFSCMSASRDNSLQGGSARSNYLGSWLRFVAIISTFRQTVYKKNNSALSSIYFFNLFRRFKLSILTFERPVRAEVVTYRLYVKKTWIRVYHAQQARYCSQVYVETIPIWILRPHFEMSINQTGTQSIPSAQRICWTHFKHADQTVHFLVCFMYTEQ